MNTIELTKKLVAIPSYVDDGVNEEKLADFIWDYLKDNLPWLKLQKQIVEGNRYNIIATSDSKPKLFFISHMDTVLPSGITTKMLTPTADGEKLCGLGTCDMKSGLAASIIAVQETGPIDGLGVIFDCDEEYYFKGMKRILGEYNFKPELAIFPEGTGLRIVNGCRGIVELQFDVIGKTAHAGTPDKGQNAIELAVELVGLLRQELSININKDLGKTTVNLSALNGARLKDEEIIIQANAVPDVARVLLDIRVADIGIDALKILKRIKKIAKNLNVKIINEKINLDYQAYLTQKNQLKKAEQAIQNTKLKVQYKVNLGQGGFFEAALASVAWNCPAISYGPDGDDTNHSPDEFVKINSVEETKNVYKEIIRSYLC